MYNWRFAVTTTTRNINYYWDCVICFIIMKSNWNWRLFHICLIFLFWIFKVKSNGAIYFLSCYVLSCSVQKKIVPKSISIGWYTNFLSFFHFCSFRWIFDQWKENGTETLQTDFFCPFKPFNRSNQINDKNVEFSLHRYSNKIQIECKVMNTGNKSNFKQQ